MYESKDKNVSHPEHYQSDTGKKYFGTLSTLLTTSNYSKKKTDSNRKLTISM